MPQVKFRYHDREQLDERAEEKGCMSRAEYLRMLVREDLQRREREDA